MNSFGPYGTVLFWLRFDFTFKRTVCSDRACVLCFPIFKLKRVEELDRLFYPIQYLHTSVVVVCVLGGNVEPSGAHIQDQDQAMQLSSVASIAKQS